MAVLSLALGPFVAFSTCGNFFNSLGKALAIVSQGVRTSATSLSDRRLGFRNKSMTDQDFLATPSSMGSSGMPIELHLLVAMGSSCGAYFFRGHGLGVTVMEDQQDSLGSASHFDAFQIRILVVRIDIR